MAEQSQAFEKDSIDWSRYAVLYDRMCDALPTYQTNIDLLLRYIREWQLPDRPRVLDLGAGTGNFVCAMSDVLPTARFLHVDADPVMNRFAAQKYRDLGVKNVNILEEHIQRLELAPSSLDLIVSVNTIYAVYPQKAVLQKLKHWLRPTGKLFLIDFGRKLNIFDWGWYAFEMAYKSSGIRSGFATIADNFEAIRLNRKGSKVQGTGHYWLHSTQEFGEALTEVGLKVEELYPCYRGYADLAICSLD